MYIDKTQQNIQIIKQVFLNKDRTKLSKKNNRIYHLSSFTRTDLSAMLLLSLEFSQPS